MAKQKTVVPFRGTQEQEKALDKIIADHKDMQGALMPVLQQAQELYGYLPIEVQTRIAEGLGISLEEVYQVVTFYGQFSLNPNGKHRVAVCLGTACYVKGSGDIYEKFAKELGVKDGACTEDGMFSLEACRCIGACGLAPVITVNEDVHGRLTVQDVEKIIDSYKQKG